MKKKTIIFDYLTMILGSAILAVGVHFFKIPNHFSNGGFSGLGIVIGALIPGMDTSTLVSIMTMASLVIGFLFIGRSMGVRTVFCTVVYSAVLELLGLVAPMNAPFTNDTFLELIINLILASFGAALVFRCGGSTGGTDIVALIVRKYTKADISVGLFVADGIVALAAFFVFDIQTGLYSLLGMLIKSFGVQFVLDALNKRKSLMIVTTKPDEVNDFIMQTIHRGATVWHGEGVFTDEKKTVILTALTTMQAAKVNAFAKKVDPQSFIIVNNTSEIYGKGFMDFDV